MLFRGFLCQDWIKTKVSVNFTHISQAAGLFLSQFVSSELDPVLHSDRGVVDCLWFSPRWSNRPVILCEHCQGVLLRRSGHVLVENTLSFCQESSKVRRYVSAKVGENSALRGGFCSVFSEVLCCF